MSKPQKHFQHAAVVLAVVVSQFAVADAQYSAPVAALPVGTPPVRLPAVTQQPSIFQAARLDAPDSDGEPDADKDAAANMVTMEEHEKLLDRLDALEADWDDHQKSLAAAAADKKKKPSMKINGRVHLDYWNFASDNAGINFLETGDPTDDPESRFDFRRIRLTVTGDVPGNMLYRIMIDFNNPNRPELKDVYLGFKNLPNNQVLLIGNQKRPLGLDHLNSSRHNVFIERPLAVETFNEDARRLGVAVYGHNDSQSLNWTYGGFLLENITDDGRYRGDFREGGLYGRVSGSPWYDEVSGGRGYLHLALVGSANQTDPNGTLDADDNPNMARFRTRPLARSDSRWWNTGRILGANAYQQLGYETMLNLGPLQITSEYFGNWVQRDPLGGFAGEDMFFHGGYLFVSYFLTGEHVPLKRRTGTIDRVKPFENFFLVDTDRGRGTGLGALCIAVRGDYLDLSDSDIFGGQGYAITSALNWYWTAYSKVQCNYIFGEISQAGQDQFGGPVAAGVAGDFDIFGFRYMIDF